ncbi:oxidoreductase [Mesorhizobium sp. L-8-10]|uniref:SDR family oxidoreductase n=1 Tax=unclassified Mesorhizobium TaxID=325217 RepID=UPI001927754E|nr:MULTISPECIES: SDR family oxidoreductase [unclassified Mesorhizobium]BCH23454.1 oxidoreductase [Mesorhizobium sp. L-8-3]BCH31235.1 oxidoreductase [Mesorhizobium sp. L-8-10]
MSPFRSDVLKGKRILVTGGGTGLGKEMSVGFAAHGAHVAICGRREQVLEDACKEIERRSGGTAEYRIVNIRDAEAVDAMVADLWTGGPLTGLVNNAGANFIAPTESISHRAYDAVRATVMDGSFYATHSCGKRWIADGIGGTVISNLVTWVWSGSAYVVPCAMAKTAIHAMTMSLAVEWGPKGIRLNAVAPGPFPTENAWEKLNPIPGSSVGATQPDKVPLRRYGDMDELRNILIFLMLDECSYVNGATIPIDGGHRLTAPSTFAELSTMGAQDWAAAREALKKSQEKERQGR